MFFGLCPSRVAAYGSHPPPYGGGFPAGLKDAVLFRSSGHWRMFKAWRLNIDVFQFLKLE
jgi:hypothetical protein